MMRTASARPAAWLVRVRFLVYRLLMALTCVTVPPVVPGCAAQTAPAVMSDCPSSPNCVSSLARDQHRIEPFSLGNQGNSDFLRLREMLVGRHDARIVAASDTVLQVEFRTRLGFVDDALFVLDLPARVIQLRSAARLGYWDLGKNRSRLEEIRRQFQQ